MKKILCVILSVLLLTFTFAACDGGSSGNGDKEGDRINNFTGEIKGDGLKDFDIGQFADENGDGAGLILENGTYEEFVSMLNEGKRVAIIGCKIKGLKDFNNKKLTKISFDVEADREVTVTFQTTPNIGNDCKTVTLQPNEKQNIVFELDVPIKPDGLMWDIDIEMSSDGTTDREDEGFVEWSQTVYKITNYKVYCE